MVGSALSPLMVEREVGKLFGSLEGLAFHVLVERPDLMEGKPEEVAPQLGLSVPLVRYLWYASREFRMLLDEGIARSVWGVAQRRQAYEALAKRVVAGEDKLSETVRAAEYLDGKVGVHSGQSGPQVAPVSVSVSVVREGSGDWSGGHQALVFGGVPAQAAGVSAQLESRTVTVGPDAGLADEAGDIKGASSVPEPPNVSRGDVATVRRAKRAARARAGGPEEEAV